MQVAIESHFGCLVSRFPQDGVSSSRRRVLVLSYWVLVHLSQSEGVGADGRWWISNQHCGLRGWGNLALRRYGDHVSTRF